MSPALGAPGSPLAFSPPPALGGGAGLTICISQKSPRELRAFEQRSQGHQVANSKGGTHTRAPDTTPDSFLTCQVELVSARWGVRGLNCAGEKPCLNQDGSPAPQVCALTPRDPSAEKIKA